MLNLLLQIPIDSHFHMQIPLTITYYPESFVYRRWHPEQGGVLPLHKEIRASHTLSKVLGELPINQVRVWVVPHLPLLQTTPQVLVGHRALDIKLVAGHEVSLLPTADDQVLGAQRLAIILFTPKLPKLVRCQAVSLIPPKARESVLRKGTMLRKVRAGSRPQAMSRRLPMVKISRSAFTPRTPSPCLVSYSASTRTPMLSLTPGRKSRQLSKGCAGTAPQKTPVDHHLLRKSCQPMRHSETGLDKKHGCLTHALKLGIVTKLPTMLWAGWCEIP